MTPESRCREPSLWRLAAMRCCGPTKPLSPKNRLINVCRAAVQLLRHFGTVWINARLPQLAASKHWHYLVSWVSSYGFVTLAAIAPSPFAQTPALILAALLGLPCPKVVGALLRGKGLKYSLVGAVTAHTTDVPMEAIKTKLDTRPPQP
ncbi:hypothetical protein [Rhodoferax sp.]|uniref:hypothetical protein n=1 Tax=Rhodoferax sp. TaxID=50421 RepID=UPI00271F6C4C|nr:hypothetical protein [Rhodoferax sp.]MDO9196847.1 hypothetical protein [Rhodoferax sp.]